MLLTLLQSQGGGVGPVATLHWRIIRGDRPDGMDDWMAYWYV